MKGILVTLAVSGLLADDALGSEYADGDRLPAATVEPLLRWVEEHMGSEPLPVPTVRLSRSGLAAYDLLFDARAPGYDLKGFYGADEIVLDHVTWRWGSVPEISVLVHELVHHVQHAAGRRHACDALNEAEAYRIQNNWLRRMGASPVQPPPAPDYGCAARTADSRR